MKKPVYVGKKGNVVVPVRAYRHKSGYRYYLLDDYSQGTRKQKAYVSLEAAKTAADDIAKAIAAGQPELCAFGDRRREIQNAIDALAPTGWKLDEAARLVAEALGLVPRGEGLEAIRYWKVQRPATFTPKRVSHAPYDFTGRREGKLGYRGARLAGVHFKIFAQAFGMRNVHEVTSLELSDLVAKRGWAAKTTNDFLKNIAMFYADAVQRGYATANIADSKVLKRRRIKRGEVGIFTPSEVRTLLSGIESDLRPAVALWCFSGCRKEEISKLSWKMVAEGLASGSLYIPADIAKTGFARSTKLESNLIDWLVKYRQTCGPVLPERCSGPHLDTLTNVLTRQSGVKWPKNAPRHSYCSYALARGDAPASVASAMGNSLTEIEQHYWARSRNLTKGSAAEWFAVRPDDCADRTAGQSHKPQKQAWTPGTAEEVEQATKLTAL